MQFEELKRRIREIPEVVTWPHMLEFVERAVDREGSVWEYPAAACHAVGGTEGAAFPAAAAVFCSVASIRLVDDLLDEDPRGHYHTIGAGQAANMGLAFQAAGHLLLDDPEIPAALHPVLQISFARMSLATCYGQHLDAREAESEEEYWRIVNNKTPPLFAEALRMGALLGGASAGAAEQLACIGRVLGRFIQVSDDVTDALEAPARADWQRRGNNLAILYAMTAPHLDRAEFLRLSTRVADPEALAAAQKILLRSGAVSYCALKLIELSREAQDLFARAPLSNPEALGRLIDIHMQPLHRLLASVGLEGPAAIQLAE